MKHANQDLRVLSNHELAVRRELTLRIVLASLVVGIVWGIYYYYSATAEATEYCRKAGQAYPCAGMQRGNLLAPFTFWLFTLPVGWLISWPLVEYLRRGKSTYA